MKGNDFHLEPPSGFDSLVRTLSRRNGVCCVIGATDTGKTSLVRLLLNSLLELGHSVAVVDADLGQSSLGLPTTVSVGLFRKPKLEPASGPSSSTQPSISPSYSHSEYASRFPFLDPETDWKPSAMCFVGSVSPDGHQPQHLAAIFRLVRLARERSADVILIDTTGAISGRSGQLLKMAKLDALSPSLIVAIQRKNELQAILHAQELLAREVVRLPVVHSVRKRTREDRILYREERFSDYFETRRKYSFPLEKFIYGTRVVKSGQRLNQKEMDFTSTQLGTKVLWGETSSEEAFLVVNSSYSQEGLIVVKDALAVRNMRFLREEDLYGLLVGLLDTEGFAKGLGVIVQPSWNKEQLLAVTPLKTSSDIVAVRASTIRIRVTGEEIGRLAPA